MLVDARHHNQELIEEWVHYLTHKRGRMPTTVYSYSHLIRQFAEHLSGMSLLDAQIPQMEGWTHRQRGFLKEPKAATISKDTNVLRSFYSWLHETEQTATNRAMALHSPAVRNVQPKSISDELWLKYWNHILVESDVRLSVAMGLGFFCGLRRQEIVDLRGDQITKDQILRFTRKGGGEDVTPWLTMHDCYAQELPHLVGINPRFGSQLLWLANKRGSDRLVGWTDSGSFNSALKNLTGRVEASAMTPHQLRHSCATNLLRCGVPLYLVSSLLNHRSVQTTMRYVRAGHDALAEWMDGQHGRGREHNDVPNGATEPPRSDGRDVS